MEMSDRDVMQYRRIHGNDESVVFCTYCHGDIYNYGGEWIACGDESVTCAKSPSGFHAHFWSAEHVDTKTDIERRARHDREAMGIVTDAQYEALVEENRKEWAAMGHVSDGRKG